MNVAGLSLAFALISAPAAAQDRFATMVENQIAPCWNVAPLEDITDYIWMFVSLDLSPDGRFDVDDIVWQENRGGTEDEGWRMYQTVERAIRRCGANGFDLPRDQYSAWRSLNLFFVLNEAGSQ